MNRLWISAAPLLFLALALPLASAAGQSQGAVAFDFDPTVNFLKYRTYSWVSRPAPEGVSPADYERARASIDRVMAARGFSKAEPGDFAIALTAVPFNRAEFRGSYRGGWASVPSISIDIYDMATRRPVWSGIGKKDLDARLTDSQLDKAIELILGRFPPSRGCSHHPANEFVEECPS
ncbi:MAG TPA: DUF4136 domain-containing protein [Allosphingosinicella sp.]